LFVLILNLLNLAKLLCVTIVYKDVILVVIIRCGITSLVSCDVTTEGSIVPSL
jgi:hypothetical protein